MKDQRPVSRYVPSVNRDYARDVARQNARNIALARSPLALSFVPPRPSTSRPQTSVSSQQASDETKDFYQTFLEAQVDELQEKVDELDMEFASLTRQSLDLSNQVKTLEGDVGGLVDALRNTDTGTTEHDRLSEIVRSSNEKLSSARSQLTQALVAKSERLKRLEAYRKELEERSILLNQHKNKPIEEREERGDRKLKSSLKKR